MSEVTLGMLRAGIAAIKENRGASDEIIAKKVFCAMTEAMLKQDYQKPPRPMDFMVRGFALKQYLLATENWGSKSTDEKRNAWEALKSHPLV